MDLPSVKSTVAGLLKLVQPVLVRSYATRVFQNVLGSVFTHSSLVMRLIKRLKVSAPAKKDIHPMDESHGRLSRSG